LSNQRKEYESMKAFTLFCLLTLSGCATVQEHPYATGVAVAIVAGSIAASARHDHQGGGPLTANAAAPNCSTGACR
jgi:uncharacterized protein YceK